MKFKSIISIIVAICILFSVQCISVFAGNASEPIDDVITVKPIDKKFEAFGFNVIEIDGHNFKDIIDSVNSAKKQDKATVIIANTIKGKGVSFMENMASWHGKAPTQEDLEKAIEELN